MKRRFVSAIWMAIVLAACTPSPEPTPTSDQPLPTASRTPRPTLTPRPTNTPEPTATVTPTPQPFVTGGGALPEAALMRIGIGYVSTAEVSPDGTRIAVGTGTGIYMFDAESLTQIWRKYTEHPIMGVSWSPDGTRLILADLYDGYVEPTVWDAETGQKVTTLSGAWQIGA